MVEVVLEVVVVVVGGHNTWLISLVIAGEDGEV